MGHHFLIANEIQGNWQYGIPKKYIPERELTLLNMSPEDVCPCILSLIYDDAHTVYHSVLLPFCYRSATVLWPNFQLSFLRPGPKSGPPTETKKQGCCILSVSYKPLKL